MLGDLVILGQFRGRVGGADGVEVLVVVGVADPLELPLICLERRRQGIREELAGGVALFSKPGGGRADAIEWHFEAESRRCRLGLLRLLPVDQRLHVAARHAQRCAGILR